MNLIVKVIGGLSSALVLGVTPLLPFGQTTLAATQSTSGVHVTVTGAPVPAAPVPANAIRLKPGQRIPQNAHIGQSFILPKRLPPRGSNILVVHADPGQKVSITNYSGAVLIVPNHPTVATIVAPPKTEATALTSSAVTGTPANTTAQIISTFPTSPQPERRFGNILDFNGSWVTVDHVMNDFSNGSNGNPLEPSRVEIYWPDGSTAVDTTDIEDMYSTTYGLASLYNWLAPYGSNYNITVVTHQTVGQSAKAVSAYNPANGSIGLTTQQATLTAVNSEPIGYNPSPAEPTNKDAYNEFNPVGIIQQGWSGAGIWNSKGHLLAMLEGADQYLSNGGYFWGMNGQDITNFCNAYAIGISSSSGT